MVQSSLSSHIDRNEHQRPIDESGWETTLRVVASLGSMASGWAVHGLGVLGYQWSVTPRPIAGQWSPATTFSAYWNLRKEAATHPALRYGAFSAAGLWAGAVKAISHMFLQEYVFAPLLHIATSDDEELDESFEAYDPIAPIKQGDMYQRGGWTGPVCAMASAAGAILMSLPFLKAKFLLRTQSRRPDGSFKYTGLFQSIGVIWREQRWGLITNNLSAFISFGILYDVVGFLTDRYKLSTLIMKIKTREGVLHNLKHALALAIDDIIEAAIIVAFTMPVNVVLRRLEAQAGGVAPFSADGVVYAGFLDCVQQIFVREGLNGFYKGAMPELLERLLPRVLVDAAVDLGLNSFFGVPTTYDSTDEHSHAD